MLCNAVSCQWWRRRELWNKDVGTRLSTYLDASRLAILQAGKSGDVCVYTADHTQCTPTLKTWCWDIHPGTGDFCSASSRGLCSSFIITLFIVLGMRMRSDFSKISIRILQRSCANWKERDVTCFASQLSARTEGWGLHLQSTGISQDCNSVLLHRRLSTEGRVANSWRSVYLTLWK